LTAPQTAEILDVSIMTVIRWCESGKLPAIPKAYGKKTTWRISPQAVEMFTVQQTQKQAQKVQRKENHPEMIPAWLKAMGKGTFNGKVFSDKTIVGYSYYGDLYFTKQKAVSAEGLKAELMKIPARQFATRERYYKAIRCLGKFLIQENCLDDRFIEEIKSLKPKRHLPPKKTTVTESQLQSLLNACKDGQGRLIIILLSQTGLRASEACALKLSDLDFENGCLIIRLGKGNKTRRVGLAPMAMNALQEYLLSSPGNLSHLLIDLKGKPMTRHGLFSRIERIGKKANVPVNPHALRRAFVTINANNGRPLQMLQKACGHGDIKTTMGYCLTSEQEVIDAMKNW